ncbi:MAG: peptidylprolyl isomerase [Bacteriovoracia bacterium]
MSSTVSASHILVEKEFEAQDLLKKLEAGEAFEALAKTFSKCPSGRNGGALGTFGKGQMVKEFETAAFALQPGEVSGPVRTQFGFHLIKRT